MSKEILKQFSKEDLEEELERREHLAPVQLDYPEVDFFDVYDYAVSIVERIKTEDRAPKDYVHYMFETVMKLVYGEDFFNWWNKQDIG